MDESEVIGARLECLRIAVESGRQRDVTNPHELADVYWQWVSQGSGGNRPDDSRKDGGRKQARKARSVREGSTPQNDSAN